MKDITLFIFLAIYCFNLQAQDAGPEILATAGESSQGTSIQLDWTIGELAITSIADDQIQVTQGFHQPQYLFSNIDKLPAEFGEIHIYPNPTSEWIEMNLRFQENRRAGIALYDENGKLLWHKKIIGKDILETKNISELPGGTYFINIQIDDSPIFKSIKIIKI